MRINQLFNFTLLTMLFGIPAGAVFLSEPVIAQQRFRLNFQNIQISSVGIQTISNNSSTTTITLSIQNYDVNNRVFNVSERVALREITLVDSQKNQYMGNLEMDLYKPFSMEKIDLSSFVSSTRIQPTLDIFR